MEGREGDGREGGRWKGGRWEREVAGRGRERLSRELTTQLLKCRGYICRLVKHLSGSVSYTIQVQH